MDLQTCRLCHKSNFEDRSAMVKIGTRHSVHWKCKFDRLPDRDARIAWLQSLPKHRLVQAPALLLDANGRFEFVANWARELEREENMKGELAI